MPLPVTTHKRSFFPFRANEVVANGASESQTIRMLTTRAMQVPHIWGYRFGAAISQNQTYSVSSQGWDLGFLLRADGEDLPGGVDYRTLIDARLGGAGNVVDRSLIDFVIHEMSISIGAAFANVRNFNWYSSDWIPCDLILPEIYASTIVTNRDTAQTNFRAFVILDYTWEDVDPGELAAINLLWNRDAQDYDQGAGASAAS